MPAISFQETAWFKNPKVFHATQDQFRTGWFLESVCSASLIVLGHTKPETLLQEQTVEISVCGDSLNGRPDADSALHSTWHDFWV